MIEEAEAFTGHTFSVNCDTSRATRCKAQKKASPPPTAAAASIETKDHTPTENITTTTYTECTSPHIVVTDPHIVETTPTSQIEADAPAQTTDGVANEEGNDASIARSIY